MSADGSYMPADALAASDAKLIANGYEPVALVGKRALGNGWTTRPNTVEAIAAERAGLPGATNTGVRTGRLSVADIDLIPSDHAEAVKELAFDVLGYSVLERVGSKGMALCYRNETPISKITVSALHTIRTHFVAGIVKPLPGKVEILGIGNQLAIYGEHPDTGRPFTWINAEWGPAEPLAVALSELPEVTPDKLREFAQRAKSLMEELGYRGVTVSEAGGKDVHRPSASHATGKRLSWEGLRKRLSYIHPRFDGARPSCYPAPSQKRQSKPLPYDGGAWLSLALCLRDGNVPLLDTEPHDWLALIEEWSSGALWYERTGEWNDVSDRWPWQGIAARLKGEVRQGGKRTSVATILEYATDGGCPLPPDDEPASAAEVFAPIIAANGAEEPASEPSGDDGELILSPAAPLKSAAAFIERKHTLRDGEHTLLHFEDGFYLWHGSHWAEADTKATKKALTEFLASAKTQGAPDKDGKWPEPVPFVPRQKIVDEVFYFLANGTHVANVSPPCWIGEGAPPIPSTQPSEIVVCKNGLLHLPTRTLFLHTPHLFNLNALPFAFDPGAAPPSRWLAFLKSLWPDDRAAIDTLQEIFGLMLTGDTSQQKIFMLVGPKRSGKGTIARVLTCVLGEANVCSPTLASLSHPFGLQPLIGKTVAIVSDARLGARVDQSIVSERLLSISGEDRQSVPRKYQTDWHGGIGARFLILSNELPRITDASATLASRFVLLTLRESFYGREDRGLTKALLREAPGILNWALDGYARLAARGYFVPPKSSAEAQQQLEELTSPTVAFVRERCVLGTGQKVECNAAYDAWSSWCHRNGHPSGTLQTFARNLLAAVPGLATVQDRTKANRGKRFFHGLGVPSLIG